MNDISLNLSEGNENEEKENRIEKLVNKNAGDNRLKNLYENVGTRVSKLREINDNYEIKIKEQENEIKKLDEQIKEKRYILEHDMRGQGGKKDEIKLHDSKWVNDLYKKLLEDGEIKMQINQNHIQNDPALKKAYQQKESELSQLKNHLNNLIKKTEHIKNEINILRIENNKQFTPTNIENTIRRIFVLHFFIFKFLTDTCLFSLVISSALQSDSWV